MTNIQKNIMVTIFGLAAVSSTLANDVKIIGADFHHSGDGSWTVNVALLHEDSGWDHYADIWRLVDGEGDILAERVLLHPHEDEQPFLRGVDGVLIPETATILYIEAHDMVHGWTANRLEVDMRKVEEGRLRVEGH